MYYEIFQGKGKWKPWADELLTAPPIPRDIAVHSIIVSTVDTVRYLALFKLLVQHKKSVMMVGPTGTGKSSYIVVCDEKVIYFLFMHDNFLI